MSQEFLVNGRGRVFQHILEQYKLPLELVEEMIQVYRRHRATISLYLDAQEVLDKLQKEKMYLVTDGKSEVQWRKIDALKIREKFDGIYVTDDFGSGAAKPSTLCFDEIRKKEKSSWEDLIYVGDDPNKDFISLNPLGVTTVRVNRGRFKGVSVSPDHEARHTVNDLTGLIYKIRVKPS
jgi:putative hydrolase of the HAD superfamily